MSDRSDYGDSSDKGKHFTVKDSSAWNDHKYESVDEFGPEIPFDEKAHEANPKVHPKG